MANEMRNKLLDSINQGLLLMKPKFTFEALADNIIADGWIRPPCKVGDTVYSFCDAFGPILILPYFIETFRIGFLDKDRDYWEWEANSHDPETDELLDEIDFDLDDIGKTVFLTKEEAEQKLKEMRGKNDA